MGIFDSISLFFALALLASIPSASVALVITQSITLGIRNGVSVALGIVLGDLIFIAAAVFGLSFAESKLGNLFILLKIAGGSYLLWLGYQLLSSKSGAMDVNTAAEGTSSLIVSVMAGLFLTLGDVKAIVFYASFLPTFVDLALVSFFDFFLIALMTVVGVGGVKIGYAVFALKFARVFQAGAAVRCLTRGAGAALLAIGILFMYETLIALVDV